jgi:hypothetical protein
MRLTLAAVFFTVALQAQQPTAHARSVLMISIDGMRPDYVTHANEHHLRLPTLSGFLSEGTYADGVTGVFPTVTYPSHTTLVTGVWPAEHGIVSNQRFDPDKKLAGAWYWYEDQIKVPTLWSAAHTAHLTTASVGWPVTVDAKDIDFLIPEYWRGTLGETDNPDDRFLMNAISRPTNELARIAARTDTPYMQGNETTAAGDEVKTIYSLDILQQHKPMFMTIHLSSLDEEEHLHGPFSAEANEDLEKLDGMVARLAEQELKNDPNAIIVIVSDHGFADIHTAVNLGVAFTQAGLIQPAKPANPLAPSLPLATWQARPWSLGCMFAIMLHDPTDTAVRQQVRTLLDKLAADPANGMEAVLDAPQVAQLGGVPDAAFVVTLRKGFAATAALTGPLTSPIPGHRGTHGYNPQTTPEMSSSFFAMGRGIPKARDLGIIDMRSIAPTLAQILGIELPAARQLPLSLK